MTFVKEFTRFFHTRSDSNADEIRSYLFGLMQAKRGAKNLERMEEHVPDFNYQAVHNTMSRCDQSRTACSTQSRTAHFLVLIASAAMR